VEYWEAIREAAGERIAWQRLDQSGHAAVLVICGCAMASHMKVALKFCGGCDPVYERVEYWEAIREAAGERIVWQRLDQSGHQVVLVICGCATACPLEDLPPDETIVAVTDDRQAPAEVVARLLGREK